MNTIAHSPIRVMVFDDNHNRRESLQYLIGMHQDMACVALAEDCSDAVALVRSYEPDVILMDIEMPNVNGIEGVRHIKEAFPAIAIIMQTVFEDDDKVFDSILAGASGYILKKTAPEKIIEAVREASAGGAPMTPSIAMRVLQFFKTTTTATDIPDYQLTSREKEILALLVDGLSYKMIAKKTFISYHTVNAHVRKIYEKLHVHSLGEAVGKALREGLV